MSAENLDMSTENLDILKELNLDVSTEHLDIPKEHNSIPCQRLSSTEAGGIECIPARLSYAEVEAKMVNELREVRLNRRNVEAVQSWEDRRLSNLEEQVKNNADSLEDLIPQYFNAFDAILFSGSLGNGCCKIVWCDGFNGARRGTLSSPRKNRTCTIKVWRRTDITDKETLFRSYVSTLLHEMIHAFLRLYTCRCDGCQQPLEPTRGHTGHGFTWQLIAREIEKTTRSKLRLRLVLGRKHNLRKELNACGLKLEEALSAYHTEELGFDVQIKEQGFNIKIKE